MNDLGRNVSSRQQDFSPLNTKLLITKPINFRRKIFRNRIVILKVPIEKQKFLAFHSPNCESWSLTNWRIYQPKINSKIQTVFEIILFHTNENWIKNRLPMWKLVMSETNCTKLISLNRIVKKTFSSSFLKTFRLFMKFIPR